MASEVAQAPQPQTEQHDSVMDAVPESTSFAESRVNGHAGPDEAAANASSFSGNATLPAMDLAVSAKTQPDSAVTDVNPAGPTPVDEVAPGIQPVAGFVPKDASTHSHPTPPPDELLTTGAADVDTEMDAAEDGVPEAASEAVTPAQLEPSLVRPREDDGDDEPAAKRTRVDGDAVPVLSEAAPVVEDSAQTTKVAPPSEASEVRMDQQIAAPVAVSASDAYEKVVEATSQTTAAAPSAAPAESAPTGVKTESTQLAPHAPDVTMQQLDDAVGSRAADVNPVEASVDTESETATAPTSADAGSAKFSTAPMTAFQKSSMVEKMRNLKKTRHSGPFLHPVDHVALNIPGYPDIVKQPMDLNTMERKLKNGDYGSVQEFVDDFELIISNVRRFNGDAHAITQSGLSMKAYFDKMMETVPTVDQAPPQKPHKKRSPSVHEPKRRESRITAAPAAAAAPPPQAASPLQQEAFALQSDGTPQIRRASSNVRPARAIKPPPNREIPYAKPRRKEHLLELRFAEHVLDEIRGPKYGHLNHVFQMPVDPVALNIPNYRQIIKQPMDLSSMVQKMKSGQYGTAGELKKDFELMIKNCLIFNPMGNPVRDLGIGLQREFEQLWAEKNKWEKKHAPASTRASSASADGDSDEEDEEGGDGADNPDDSTVAALKKQIAAMQSTLESLSGAPNKPSTKSAKTQKKSAPKKAIGAPAAASSKGAAKTGKPKRERMITYEEKDEISKAVERMDEKQIGKLTEIITRECPKYRDMEEMELEIDDLPNGVQLMLLKYVRGIFGGPAKKAAAARDYSPDDVAAQDDDDFEPKSRGAGGRGGGGGGKRKKHAPMSKMQQEEQLRALQGKLAEFSNAATSGSESPTASNYRVQNAQPESSGDEESEESEEE